MCYGKLLPLLVADNLVFEALEGSYLRFRRAGVRQLDKRGRNGGAAHGANGRRVVEFERVLQRAGAISEVAQPHQHGRLERVSRVLTKAVVLMNSALFSSRSDGGLRCCGETSASKC